MPWKGVHVHGEYQWVIAIMGMSVAALMGFVAGRWHAKRAYRIRLVRILDHMKEHKRWKAANARNRSRNADPSHHRRVE